ADKTVRLAWVAAGGRLALVTDATAGAANGGGIYQLGDVEIEIAGGPPTREDGVLAGTVLTMIDAVRNVHALGIPLEDAISAATTVPARILGRSDVGVLAPGGRANRVPVMFATPSLYTIYEQPPRLEGAVVLGISQSGASPDVRSVISEARRQGRPTLALTNDPDSPLAREADVVLPLEAGEERAG